jgi:hypothetical protein
VVREMDDMLRAPLAEDPDPGEARQPSFRPAPT